MLIKVTEDDIKIGNRKDCKTCPIAQALSKLMKDGVVVKVRIVIADIFEVNGKRRWRKLPELASEFILRYDSGEIPQPFEFELDIPEELLKCPPSPQSDSTVVSSPA